MNYTQAQINKAIGDYCVKKGRPAFTMDFNRKAKAIINAGRKYRTGIYAEIHSLLPKSITQEPFVVHRMPQQIYEDIGAVVYESAVSEATEYAMLEIAELLFKKGKMCKSYILNSVSCSGEVASIAIILLHEAGILAKYRSNYRLSKVDSIED